MSLLWLEIEDECEACMNLILVSYFYTIDKEAQSRSEAVDVAPMTSDPSVRAHAPGDGPKIRSVVLSSPQKTPPLQSYYTMSPTQLLQETHSIGQTVATLLNQTRQPIQYENLSKIRILYCTHGFTSVYPLLSRRTIDSHTQTVFPMKCPDSWSSFPRTIPIADTIPDSVSMIECFRYLDHFGKIPQCVLYSPLEPEEILRYADPSDSFTIKNATHLIPLYDRCPFGFHHMIALYVALRGMGDSTYRTYRLVDKGATVSLERNDRIKKADRPYFPRIRVIVPSPQLQLECLTLFWTGFS